MAPDRSNESGGERFPSVGALTLLRGALSRYVKDADDEQPVCDALTVLAREAQERKLYAEHMLIAFKRVWNDMPEVQAIPAEAERKRLLSRLVKLCIDTYYKRYQRNGLTARAYCAPSADRLYACRLTAAPDALKRSSGQRRWRSALGASFKRRPVDGASPTSRLVHSGWPDNFPFSSPPPLPSHRVFTPGGPAGGSSRAPRIPRSPSCSSLAGNAAFRWWRRRWRS